MPVQESCSHFTDFLTCPFQHVTKKILVLLIVVFGSSEKLPATRGYSNSGLDVLAQTVLKPYLQRVVSHTAEQTFFKMNYKEQSIVVSLFYLQHFTWCEH